MPRMPMPRMPMPPMPMPPMPMPPMPIPPWFLLPSWDFLFPRSLSRSPPLAGADAVGFFMPLTRSKNVC